MGWKRPDFVADGSHGRPCGWVRAAGFTVPLGNGAIALLPFMAGNGTVRVAVEVDGYTQ